MVSRQRRITQLQENVMIRSSLLVRQAEEFKTNLITCVNETHNEAVQCVRSIGQNQADVQILQNMLKKIEKITEGVTTLNSSFLDLLENSDSDREEGQASRGELPGRNGRNASSSPPSLQQALPSPSPHTQASDNDTQPRHHLQPEAAISRVSPAQVITPPLSTSSSYPMTAARALNPAFTFVPTPTTMGPQAPTAPLSLMTSRAPAVAAAMAPQFAAQLPGITSIPAPWVSSSVNVPSLNLLTAVPTASVRTIVTTATVSSARAGPPLGSAISLADGQCMSARGQVSVPREASVVGEGAKGSQVPPYPAHPSHPQMTDMLPGVGCPGGMSVAGQQGHVPVKIAQEKPLGQDKLPVSAGSVQVLVTHVENPWSFYVVRNQKAINLLNEQISQHVWQTWDLHNNVGIGSLCLSQFNDGVFYRARVDQVYPDATAAVYFVDYGNVYITKVKQLLVLPPHFRELPALAIHCCLCEVRPLSKTGLWTQKVIDEFRELVNGEVVHCRPLPLSLDFPHLPLIVDLTLDGMANNGREDENRVRQCLIKSQLACATHNEDLVVRLQANTDCCPSVPPTPLPYPDPQARPTIAANAVSHVLTVPQPVESSAPSDEGVIMTHRQLQSILRRMPRMSKNLAQQKKDCEKKGIAAFSRGGDFERMRGDGGLASGDGQKKLSDAVSCGGDSERKVVGTVSSLGDSGDIVSSSKAGVKNSNGRAEGNDERAADTDSHDGNRTVSDGNGASSASDGGPNTEVYKTLTQGLSDSNDYTFFKAMVAAVISPTDFYLHKLSPESGHILATIMKEIDRLFTNAPQASLKLRSRKLDTKNGSLCCAQFTDGSYYRGVILQTESADCNFRQVKVFFMDFGDTVWIPRSQVYPLPSEFHDVAPQAVWCSLAYVRPLLSQNEGDGGSGDGAWQWDKEAVRQFEELLNQDSDKIFNVLASGRLPQHVGRADVLQKRPLQVIMEDKDGGNICINHDLIIRNFAAPHLPTSPTETTADKRPCGQAQDEGDGDGEGEDQNDDASLWQDMELDAKSLRNTYKVDVDDAGVALTGVKARGRQQGICKFYNYPSSCHKGAKCPYLHMDPGSQTGVTGNLAKVTVFEEDQSDLLPAVGTVVTVEVTCIISPSLFYVIMPWGPFTIEEVTRQSQDVKDYQTGETLSSLHLAMAKFYKNKRLDSDYSLYASGQAVAAFCERSRSWLRAKVIDIEPDEECVLVMYVDFGDQEWVKEHKLRQLDMQFLPLPPQAVECSLIGIVPPPPNESWPDRCISEFFQLVNGKTIVAHVRERLWSGRLSVELYDTSQTEEDIDIKTALINKGLAAACPSDTNSITKHTDTQDSDGQETAQDGDVTTYVPG